MKTVAIIGSGPAALMAASILSEKGVAVRLFEKKKGPGRKFLIAGSSGLNLTNSLDSQQLPSKFTGPQSLWESVLSEFSPKAWLDFVNGLGIKTFEGSGGRYFVKGMKASKLLRAWLERLEKNGASIAYEKTCNDFKIVRGRIQLSFKEDTTPFQADAALFCLGGGSYESPEAVSELQAFFVSKDLDFKPFRPANVGFQVHWSEVFLKEAEGLPIKNTVLQVGKRKCAGELIVTKYGIEGTPIYSIGEIGPAKLDLLPDLSETEILGRLNSVKENLSPIRRVKKKLKLCDASLALLFHQFKGNSVEEMTKTIKDFPIDLVAPQPLAEAISSAGGLAFHELNDDLMLNKFRGVFVAGEVLDWSAPTGGYLIQGCVSLGARAAHGILRLFGTP